MGNVFAAEKRFDLKLYIFHQHKMSAFGLASSVLNLQKSLFKSDSSHNIYSYELLIMLVPMTIQQNISLLITSD